MSPMLGAQSITTLGRRFERVKMRETMATALIAAAIVGLATPSLIHRQEQQATAQTVAVATPAPSQPTLPLSVSMDSGEVRPFAFGYLVFENDPADGVPGFGPLPTRASAR